MQFYRKDGFRHRLCKSSILDRVIELVSFLPRFRQDALRWAEKKCNEKKDEDNHHDRRTGWPIERIADIDP
jgi:hypothetical protein